MVFGEASFRRGDYRPLVDATHTAGYEGPANVSIERTVEQFVDNVPKIAEVLGAVSVHSAESINEDQTEAVARVETGTGNYL